MAAEARRFPSKIDGWLVFITTCYVVTQDRLVARGGPCRRTVPLALIRTLRSTRSIMGNIALSADRIEITGEFGELMVSPRDKRAFVRAILTAAPAATVEGDLAPLVEGH